MRQITAGSGKRLGTDRPHFHWSAAVPPRLQIDAGETVVFETGLGVGRRYSPNSTAADVLKKPAGPSGIELTGPVLVRGARPGDALEIEILEVAIGSWGYTAIEPGFGLLKDEFREPVFRSWDLSDGRFVHFSRDIRVPLRPFLGTIGVAPLPPLEEPSIPPRRWGGNIDVKQLTAGARLWLPVAAEGALLSVGDAHGAQGDGEVCGTAVETTATATLRISIAKGLDLSSPELQSGPRDEVPGREHCTTGVGPDLLEAARDAVRAMIRYLERSWNLSREDAYILSSIAVDLRINEVVDQPNWVVSACLPLSIHR